MAHSSSRTPLPKMWKKAFMPPANIDVKSSLVFMPLRRTMNPRKDDPHRDQLETWLAELEAKADSKFDHFLIKDMTGRIDQMSEKLGTARQAKRRSTLPEISRLTVEPLPQLHPDASSPSNVSMSPSDDQKSVFDADNVSPTVEKISEENSPSKETDVLNQSSTTVTITSELAAPSTPAVCGTTASETEEENKKETVSQEKKRKMPRRSSQLSFASMVNLVRQQMDRAAATPKESLAKLLDVKRPKRKVNRLRIATIPTRLAIYTKLCKELRVKAVHRFVDNKLTLFLERMAFEDEQMVTDRISGVPTGLLPSLFIRLQVPNSEVSGDQLLSLMMTEVRQQRLHVEQCKRLGWSPEDTYSPETDEEHYHQESQAVKKPGHFMESVDVGNNGINDLSFKFILEVTQFTLMDLDLSHNKITLSSVTALANTLKAASCHLVNLCIAYTDLKDRSIQTLSHGIGANSSLQRLSLEGNQISDAGGEHLYTALRYRHRFKESGRHQHHHHRHIRMDATPRTPSRGIRRKQPLERSMSWSRKQEKFEGDPADYHHTNDLVQPLRVCLVSLSVARNSLQHYGAKLVELSEIESLDLSFNPMGTNPYSATVIATALGNNTTLKHLNLDFCRFSHRDLDTIGEGLIDNQTLLGIHTLSHNVAGHAQDSLGFLVSTGLTEHPVPEDPNEEPQPLRIKAHNVLNKSRTTMLERSEGKKKSKTKAKASIKGPLRLSNQVDPEPFKPEGGKWIDAQSWAMSDESSYARKSHHGHNHHADCWVCGGWREVWLIWVRRKKEVIDAFNAHYKEQHRDDQRYNAEEIHAAALKEHKKRVGLPVRRVFIHFQCNDFKPREMRLCPKPAPPEDELHASADDVETLSHLPLATTFSMVVQQQTAQLNEQKKHHHHHHHHQHHHQQQDDTSQSVSSYIPRAALCQLLPPGRQHFFFTIEHMKEDGTIVNEHNVFSKHYQSHRYDPEKYKTIGPAMTMNFVDVKRLRGCPFTLVSTVPRARFQWNPWIQGAFRASSWSFSQDSLFRSQEKLKGVFRDEAVKKSFKQLWVSGRMNEEIVLAENKVAQLLRKVHNIRKQAKRAMSSDESSPTTTTTIDEKLDTRTMELVQHRPRPAIQIIKRAKIVQDIFAANFDKLMDIFNYLSFEQHNWDLKTGVGTGEMAFRLSESTLWKYLSSSGAALAEDASLCLHDVDLMLYMICGHYQQDVDYRDLGDSVPRGGSGNNPPHPFPIQRVHFMPIMLHVAAHVFPQRYGGPFSNPGTAVQMLLDQFVVPGHKPQMQPWRFRNEFLFTEQVDHFFHHHMHIVQRLFSVFADTAVEIASRDKPAMPRTTNLRHPMVATKPQVVGVSKRLTWRRWITFCLRAHLVEKYKLTLPQARDAFFSSKSLKEEFAPTANDKTLQSLDILEFMQAIARLAQIVVPASTQADEWSKRAVELCRTNPHPHPNPLFRADGLSHAESIWTLVRQLSTLFVDYLIPLFHNIER